VYQPGPLVYTKGDTFHITLHATTPTRFTELHTRLVGYTQMVTCWWAQLRCRSIYEIYGHLGLRLGYNLTDSVAPDERTRRERKNTRPRADKVGERQAAGPRTVSYPYSLAIWQGGHSHQACSISQLTHQRLARNLSLYRPSRSWRRFREAWYTMEQRDIMILSALSMKITSLVKN